MSFANRINEINNFVDNYDDMFQNRFVENQKQQYQKKLSDIANKNLQALVKSEMSQRQQEALAQVPVLYQGLKASAPALRNRAVSVGETLGSAAQKVGQKAAQVGDKIMAKVGGTTTQTPIDTIGADDSLHDVLLDGGNIQSATTSEVEGGATSMLESAGSAIKTAGEQAGKLVGEYGGAVAGGALTGLGGYETAKELGGSTATAAGVAAAEGALALAAPELALPLAVGDAIVSGFEDLFGGSHHHKAKPAPPPKPFVPPPMPRPETGVSRGEIATPVVTV